jgi:DNA-binding NarL/FixJ family response regulator
MEQDISSLIPFAIADDHPAFRKGVISILERMNMHFVAEAGNGKELLEKISTLERLPDLCILDINMPIMNGHEALKEIRKRWPHIKVLMLTMHNSKAMVRLVIADGAAGYLVKDGPPEQLERAVRDIMNFGYYRPELSGAD